MVNYFENLLNHGCVRIATKYNVVVELDIEKIAENEYSIDCLYHSNESFDLPKVLIQLNSNASDDKKMNPDELKNELYKELDKVRRCERCKKVYLNNRNDCENHDCPSCMLELDYISSSDEKFSFNCGLCNMSYWKYYGKVSGCCKGSRICLGCCAKVIERGFCSYCRAPVDVNDFI